MSTDSQLSQSDSTDSVESESTPGQYLRVERERRGLSQKEVADKLHITMHYVNALENDAYEKLPGTIFAKGYMKRYAEILQLEESVVMSRFENFQQAQQEHEKEVTRITRRKHQARNLNFALISVVLFAGIFAGLWFWNSSSSPIETVVSGAENAVVQEDLVELVETDDAIVTTSEAISLSGTANEIGQQSLASAAPVRERETSSSVSTSDPELERPDANVNSATSTLPADYSQSPLTEASTNERIITIENAGDDVLRVSFSDESFIQVTDRNDNRLYRGVLQSGDVLEITDSAPFDILLENAPPTRLSLNGNEIDVSDSIRIDNSARLTVGL